MHVYLASLQDNNMKGPMLIRAGSLEEAAKRLNRRGVHFTAVEWFADNGEVVRGLYGAGHRWAD